MLNTSFIYSRAGFPKLIFQIAPLVSYKGNYPLRLSCFLLFICNRRLSSINSSQNFLNFPTHLSRVFGPYGQ